MEWKIVIGYVVIIGCYAAAAVAASSLLHDRHGIEITVSVHGMEDKSVNNGTCRMIDRIYAAFLFEKWMDMSVYRAVVSGRLPVSFDGLLVSVVL